MIIAVRGLLLIACLLSMALALYLLQADYRVLDVTLRSHFPNIHENTDTARLGITPLRLFLLVVTFALIALVSGLIFFCLPQQAQQWREGIKNWAAHQKAAVGRWLRELADLSVGQQCAAGGILLVALLFNLYRGSQPYYNGDEVYSYVYFVHNGFLTTLCHYPDTNNHVFFNLLCILLDWLFSNPAWVMRPVSFIAHLLLLLAVFLFVRRHFGYRPAVMAMAMGAFFLPSSLYAIYGRGHVLMSLFALVALFNMYAYTLYFRSRHLTGFVVASVLAFYTVPTYIHCFLSVCAFGLYEGIRQRNGRGVGNIIKAGLITALGTVLLYWPIILFSGIESLLANKWVTYEAGRFREILVISVVETIHYVLGTPAKGYWLAVALMIPFAYAFFRTNWSPSSSSDGQTMFDTHVARWLRLLVISVLVTALVIVLHRVYPPYRVWTYFSFLCQITVAILLEYYLRRAEVKIRPRVEAVLTLLTCGIILGIGIGQYQRFEHLPESMETYRSYRKREEAVRYLMSRNPSAVLIEDNESDIYYFLPFYRIIGQKQFRIDRLDQPHRQRSYDFVICHPESFPTQLSLADFQPLFQIRQTVVYERKRLISPDP
jgi:hypothetical protein